jgi:hypothetical protein
MRILILMPTILKTSEKRRQNDNLVWQNFDSREKTFVLVRMDYDMEEYCVAASTLPENTNKAFAIGSRIEGSQQFIGYYFSLKQNEIIICAG